MTLLIKIQKTLVTFSLTLIVKVRVFFIFLWRWINYNLFEFTSKNTKRNKRSNVLVFKSSLSVYTKEYSQYDMSVLKILIFRNILPCKPPLTWYTFSMTDTHFYETFFMTHMSLLSLEKICYVTCTITCAGQLICLCASLHKYDRAGVINKPSLKSKVQ